jgi:TonB-linked SusC/RagA family outer membrane protein
MNKHRKQKKGEILKFLSIFLLISLFSYQSYAQQTKTVVGIVTDSGGEPLAGVSIAVKDSKKSSITDSEGKFKINLSSNENILIFSYLGFTTRNILIEKSVDLTVVLKESISQMNEVVVIGYGTVQRKDLTGSVGTVSITDLQKAPVKTFDEALAGRVAGVQVNSSEGQPGSGIDITIRGNNSITQSNYPLFVIDGFPIESAGDQAVNPLNTIDPNDIESIDVLKDASATAIYGARGANGVIMVTTKRGKTGAPVVSYNAYYGLQQSNKRLESLNPYDFVKLQWELDPGRTQTLYFTDGKTLESYRDVKGINWEDQVTRIAPMSNHYLNLAGGTDKTKYSATLSYTGQDGVLINSGFNRTLGKFVLDQEVNKKLKVGINSTYSGVKNYGSPTSTSGYVNETNMLFSVWAFRPLAVNPNVNLLDQPFDPEVEQASNNTFNPVLTANNELRENYGTNFNANGYLEYAANKYLKFRFAGGYNSGIREYDVFNGKFSRAGFFSNNAISGSKTFFKSSGWQNSNTATYSRRINKNHYFDAMVGFTAEAGYSSAFGANAILLPNEGLGLNGLDEGTPSLITAYSSEWKLASFLGRINYKLFDRFLFTATMRTDGSSRFQGDHIWGYFPSAAAAWQMDKESFMKRIPQISTAKLRVSWGITGNNAVSNFASYSAMAPLNTDPSNPNNNYPGYTYGGSHQIGLASISIGNPDLKWESTRQIDIGYNLGLFKDRLNFEVDIYEKRTKDLLINADMSPNTGYFRSVKNIGEVSNRGLELSLSYSPIMKKDFTWNSSINIAFNRNKVVALNEGQHYIASSQSWGDDWRNIPGYVAIVNQPIAQFYGLVYDGVYGYDDFVKIGSSYQLKNDITTNGTDRRVLPGDAKYKDLNGDLIIDENDKTIIGNPIPKHTGGFNNNFSYKAFDLNVFLQWSYGNDILNANRIVFESAYKYGYNQWASYNDRWSPDNQDSDIPGIGSFNSKSLKAYSSRVVEDGSFLRLKTVSLGYKLPKQVASKVYMKSARIYVAAQNLYTFTNYSGYDPEVSVRRSALTPGFDFSAYPRARTITFGITSTF